MAATGLNLQEYASVEVPAGPALSSHDPRGQYDDPLLDSLLTLCEFHQKPASRAMLLARGITDEMVEAALDVCFPLFPPEGNSHLPRQISDMRAALEAADEARR